MPKVTTSNWQLPAEPMLADVPIRVSARPPRFPSGRHRRNEWVATSYVPPFSTPTEAFNWGYAQGQVEDVTMGPPPAEIATKTEQESQATPVSGSLLSQHPSGGPIQAIEKHANVEGVPIQLHPVVQATRIQVDPTAYSTVGLETQGFPVSQVRFEGPNGVSGVAIPRRETDRALSASQPTDDAEDHRRANRRTAPTSIERAMGEAEDRFRMEVAVQTIDSLNVRIHKLEKLEQRLRKQVREERDSMRNSKAEAEGALNLLVLAEEKICEIEAMMAILKQDVDRYRGWWLTEYYSLKALLAMLPRDRREGAYHIAESAHARFATFSKA